MAEARTVSGDVIARDVTFDNYMKYFAADFAEWVEGVVVKMSPVTEEHDSLFQFLIRLFGAYLDETDVAVLKVAPFVMRIPPRKSGREPDLQLILKSRAHIVQRTFTDGAADVVIEIISPESEERDTEEKFAEYQAGGVSEYWLLAPIQKQARFYRLVNGLYQPIELADGIFRSTVLPRFSLDVTLLWSNPLPNNRQILAIVEAMLKDNSPNV